MIRLGQSIVYPCPVCNGKGEFMDGEPCCECKADGSLVLPIGWVELYLDPPMPIGEEVTL